MDRQGHAPGFRLQPLLEIGPQRDHKKSAADPGEEQEDRPSQRKDSGQRGEGFQMQGERQHGTGKLDPEEQGKRHAQRPERYQTRLDLFRGKPAGEQTAHRKADHRCSLEQTGGKEVAVPAGPFVLKQNQQQGQNRADGEEEIFSQRRQQFGGAVPQIPQTGKDLSEKTLFNGHGDGETHLERGIKSQQGQARTGEQHGEGIPHQSCRSDPGKQGNVGPDPHGPVGAGKIFLGECFRQDAIECRNRQCPDRDQNGEDGKQTRHLCAGPQGNEHQDQLQCRRKDECVAFRNPVRQKSGGDAEDHLGQQHGQRHHQQKFGNIGECGS